MIAIFPFKLWSTTVYKDFGTSQDQSNYCQKECIYHAHTGGFCAIIAALDSSTVADEEYLYGLDIVMKSYSN
jgi:hypothetical protein